MVGTGPLTWDVAISAPVSVADKRSALARMNSAIRPVSFLHQFL